MTQTIVLRSLEELGRFADLLLPSDEPSSERALVPVAADPDMETELASLAEAAGRAASQLREMAEADASARQAAEESLARYRRLQGQVDRLAKVGDGDSDRAHGSRDNDAIPSGYSHG